MSQETALSLDDLGGQIPPHRVFRVVVRRAQDYLSSTTAVGTKVATIPADERTVMAHMMNVVDESGGLVFYTWRASDLNGQIVVVQYCTDAFAKWDEAHEVQMPAVKAGKAH